MSRTSPMTINYIGQRTDRYAQLCLDVANALHLSLSCLKLLTFYCSCQDGFSPALSLCKKETGLSESTVKRSREALAERGVIGLDEYDLYIDWNRLHTYAMLDPTQTRVKHPSILPIPTPRQKNVEAIDWLCMSVTNACKVLQSLSEDEWTVFTQRALRLKQQLETPYHTTIEDRLASISIDRRDLAELNTRVTDALNHLDDWCASDDIPF